MPRLPILNKRTIIDTPDNKGVEVRHGRHVIPSRGDVHMRCGGCGSLEFIIHIHVKSSDTARLTTAVCSTCGKLFAFNNKGETGGTMTVQKTNGYRHRQAINERHDND